MHLYINYIGLIIYIKGHFNIGAIFSKWSLDESDFSPSILECKSSRKMVYQFGLLCCLALGLGALRSM